MRWEISTVLYPRADIRLELVSSSPTTEPDTVFYNTIQVPWNLFHLLNGSSYAWPKHDLNIHPLYNVCGDPENGLGDCVEVCSRSSDLFSSWRVLWHCLILASLSLAETSFPGLDQESLASINNALIRASITNATAFPSELVFNQTFECAMASCAQEGACKMNNLNASYIVDGRIYWNFIYDSVKHLCEGSEIELNADIAGPGVLASYIVQTVIAMYVWVFFMLPKTLNAMGRIARVVSRLLRHIGFITQARTYSPSLSQWIGRTTLAHATTTFLVEFHEAQCYFVMSIGAALLYAKSRPRYSGSNNWGSLSEFAGLVSIIASAGAWPVILTQATLHRMRLDPVYYLALSTIALTLVTVAANPAIAPDIDDVYDLFEGYNTVLECGGNTSLRSFCLPRSNFPDRLWWTRFNFYVTFLIGLLWLTKILEGIANISWLHNMYRGLTQRQQRRLARVGNFFKKSSTFVFLISEGVAIAYLSMNMIDLVDLHRQLDVEDWGIGQIIAVLLWAPVISKYLLLIVFGIEKGFVYRISQAFMVVRRSSESEDDDDRWDTSSSDTTSAPEASLAATPNATPLVRVRYA